MKDIRNIIIFLLVIAVLTGCKNNDEAASRIVNTNNVENILKSGMEAEDSIKSNKKEETTEKTTEINITATPSVREDNKMDEAGDIDLDLTEMSSTMVYSEVYKMMVNPSDYIGKTVKMDGLFSVYLDEATGRYYFACIIQDATACCAQGIEFEPEEECKYPDDFPKEGEKLCVTGIFDTYNEGDYCYCTLRKAKYSFL